MPEKAVAFCAMKQRAATSCYRALEAATQPQIHIFSQILAAVLFSAGQASCRRLMRVMYADDLI